jgi:hypothetical protein
LPVSTLRVTWKIQKKTIARILEGITRHHDEFFRIGITLSMLVKEVVLDNDTVSKA